ncbi:MAG TPA: type II toxin-antitoxin system PemK/MazF family toxin [Vicinamibacteria bacterium]|nr:type II toxin-antitoxin system PemK/MazF family toxin [Vicinamibacteria bacterium]
MAREVSRGEIWRYRFSAPDKRRPVLVLTRPEVIGLLHTVMVAPVTSTIRGAPSEVVVGVKEGLKHESAVNLDHVQTVERARLTSYVGHLGPDRMREVCRALSIAVGCDG